MMRVVSEEEEPVPELVLEVDMLRLCGMVSIYQ